jgi:hypothetical protein
MNDKSIRSYRFPFFALRDLITHEMLFQNVNILSQHLLVVDAVAVVVAAVVDDDKYWDWKICNLKNSLRGHSNNT